jgi:hypothetical protein
MMDNAPDNGVDCQCSEPDKTNTGAAHLEGWQRRLVIERNELAIKLAALERFVDSPEFDALPARTAALMAVQQVVMGQYVAVLSARIAQANLVGV